MNILKMILSLPLLLLGGIGSIVGTASIHEIASMENLVFLLVFASMLGGGVTLFVSSIRGFMWISSDSVICKIGIGILMVISSGVCVICIMSQCSSVNLRGDESKLDNYYIHSSRDLSYNGVVRMEYRVDVGGEPTKEELVEIAEQIIEQKKKEEPFNAVTLLFYNDSRFIGKQDFKPPLGFANYAPGGKWENAGQVNTGDYQEMMLNDSDIIDKRWEFKPSEDDMKVYKAWEENRDSYLEASGAEFVEFEQYANYLSGILGLDADMVLARYFNVDNWRSNTIPE